MKLVTRKKFLLSGISLISLPSLLSLKKETSLKLSFSTLGCPDWTFDKIIDFARINQYGGIEVRGILHQMDLPLVPEFSSTEAISTTMKKMNDHGLKFVDLGSSCALHFPKGDERTKNLDEGKRFIDLAAKLNCPYIRVFPNQIPKERDRQETLNLIIDGLKELGAHASNSNVTILLESHGELIYKKDLLYVMEGAASPHVGLVWDVCNMWILSLIHI